MKKFLTLSLALMMLLTAALVSCNKDDGYVDDGGNDDDDDGGVVITTTVDPSKTTTTVVADVFEACDEQVYVKNCLKINLRKEPNLSSGIAATLDFGDEKTYHRVATSATWSKIELSDGTVGYAKSAYFTTKADFVCFDAVEKVIYANVFDESTNEAGNLILRNFTDTEAEFSAGTVVKHGVALKATGLSKNGQWYRVEFDSDNNGKVETYYVVNGKYVSETNPVEATTTTTAGAAQN